MVASRVSQILQMPVGHRLSCYQETPSTSHYRAAGRQNVFVFADGKTNQAVGVAATPESLEFVLPGQGHELLGDGIPDTVVLSVGSRLEKLRERVHETTW